MRTNAQIIHEASVLLSGKLTAEDERLLRAAQHYIAVALGEKPRPASNLDLAADAYAARTGELAT